MVVNATLFVQAFNFFIAYLMLRFLLFKPALKALEQERKEREHLDEVIDEREKTLAQKTEEKEKVWAEKRKAFQDAAPDIEVAHVGHTDVTPEHEPVVPEEKEIEQLVKQVQEEVEKKVQHDEQ